MNFIAISIVEDISDIREGMRFLVNQTPGFKCISVYDNAEDAFKGLPADAPDIVIMDIALPQSTGIDCIKKLKAKSVAMQFMVFTVYEDSNQVFEALAAGANGYLLKNTAPDKIIAALHELYEGGSPMSLSIARKVVASFQKPVENNQLSNREMDVLTLLSKGYLYKEIAEKLFISTGTVKQHIHNIYEKLHVQNRTEALNKVFGRNA
ncbi:response regulator [Parafilimonas sp.]|uniref:response regulator n=1 Tax=Parafilimonas sp. TaxID=1969739 RepID=UPI0039E4803E